MCAEQTLHMYSLLGDSGRRNQNHAIKRTICRKTMYQLPNSGKTLSPHLILLQLVSFISVLPGMPAAWITNPAEYVDPELSEGQEDDG